MRDKIIAAAVGVVLVVIIVFAGVGGFLGYQAIQQLNDNIQTTASNVKDLGESVEDQTDEQNDRINDSLSGIDLGLKINGIPTPVKLNVINPRVNARSLAVGIDNRLSLDVPVNTTVTVNGHRYTKPMSLRFDRLSREVSHNTVIKISRTTGEQRTITIPSLPSDFPNLEVSGQNFTTPKGDYYGNVGTGANTYVYRMTPAGSILYYRRGQDIDNLKKYVFDGKTYYSFFEAVPEYNQIKNFSLKFGQIVLLDDQYRQINRIRLTPTKKLPQGGYAENHDYIFLSPTHYILMGEVYSPIRDDKGNTNEMRSTYIQELNGGKVGFEWLSSEHHELDDSYQELMDNNEDYMHSNSLVIDPKDDNFILSARNQDAVMKINHRTGDIIWTLGGKNDQFGLPKDQRFSRQHYAYFDNDHNLLLFDNGVASGHSTIKRYTLDEKNHKVTAFRNFDLGDHFSMYCGSVQQISPDRYFIGWGMASNKVLATLYDFRNDKVISEIVSSSSQSYRTQYFE
ncbi:aryl-sulfate sulfotransferase [Bifidobacterium sp. 82T24]|uniref:aryl-sulfate sulfotransferase n=1 Tax=Bifidobacterium pluvialisilvae TaxID=2834436 RepID=UPI001C588668|nr:aryl-sulfate sulfotransferase [Bifidobacterium pluvialisilvae]MBW3087261.1 aryl-sulfate sulfotransferase [Bifidobacterium pluvialisilvae]